MFSSVNYIEFENEVPSYWQQLSKQCVPFNVSIPIEKGWKSASKRVLIVIGHVSSEDIKNKRLLSGVSKETLVNCFNYAAKSAVPYDYKSQKDTAYAAINFNYFKNYHLKDKERTKSDEDAAKRVKHFIKKCNPTHIFVIGDATAKALFANDIPFLLQKKGWVHELEVAGKQRKLITTIEYADALVPPKGRDDDEDDQDDSELSAAYILGYFCRNIRNLLIDKLPHSIAKIKVKPCLVDTIEKFDKMMKVLNEADKIAFDTETESLNKIVNKMLVIQFSVNTKYGFVLPYLHKDTPFSTKQLLYIKKELRKFFMKKVPMNTDKYLVAFNGKFDITIIKQALGIPFIYWPIYDAQAGEHCHDETLRFLESHSETPHGGMAQICCNYGSDFYFTAAFSKKDRGNMAATSLSDTDFLDYCAADTQLLLGLHDSQLERAKHIIHKEDGKAISYYQDFLRLVVCQMSNNVHIFANMEHRGVHMDAKYVAYMKTKESPISQAIYKHTKSFNKLPEAQQVNDILLEDAGVRTEGGLFDIKPWVFNIGKPQHKQILFFQVLGLKPLNFGKKGDPKMDKAFKAAYKDNPIVAQLEDLEKLKKLKSSYVDAFARQLNEPDGKTDNRLRPMFGFFKVLSGRSNSEKPSLQQVPQHSANAKYIKRMFAPAKGQLIIKMDYSAHEVRGWSIISGDMVLAEVFALGRRLRQKFFKTGKKKYTNELKFKGDVHRLNANFFFGTPVDQVSKEERNAIKGVTFGAIYGMSPSTLAKNLKKALDFVKDLYSRFFGRFKKASGWLNWTREFGARNLFARSLIGRRRHLYGHLVGNKGVSGAMDRRAMNSPIQGMGADFSHTGSRIFEMNMYEYLLKVGELTKDSERCPIGTEIMVHDSIFTSAAFKYVLATAQIMQWCTTMGVQRYYDKHFGVSFTVPLEIEIEFGASQDKTYKFDWSLEGYDPEIHEWNETLAKKYGCEKFPEDKRISDGAFSLEAAIYLALKDHCELYPDVDFKKAYKEIYASWNDSKMKKYLDERYPILADFTPGKYHELA